MSEEPTGRALDTAIAELRGWTLIPDDEVHYLAFPQGGATDGIRLPEWHGKDCMDLLTWWLSQNVGNGLDVQQYDEFYCVDVYAIGFPNGFSDEYTNPAETPSRIAQAIYRALKAQQEATQNNE